MNSAITESQPAAANERILAQLSTLLADRRFASAERNARFLRYVVERTLEGKQSEIKETVIAAEVYGRPADYDPKTDSIVRVEATRLRQKLKNYYENEGRSAEIQIHLPTGTYVPRFESPGPSRTEPPRPAPISPMRPRLAWAATLAMAILALTPQFAKVARTVDSRDPAAVTAWEEGVALLGQDPHVAQTDRGAPPTLLQAIERIELAVAKDPKFARAWATLAEAYDYVYAYVGRDPGEDARRAEAAARRAIALDSNLAAGHHMLGLVLWGMKWDLRAAEAAYRRALELDPKNMYAAVEFADVLRETGRAEQAAELIRKSRALLPSRPHLAAKEAEIQLDLGRLDAAADAARTALQLKRNFLRAHVALGMAEEIKGNTEAALARYQHVLAVDPFDRRALPAYGYLLARSGQRDRAREVAKQLEHINATIRNCAFQLAVVYAGLGEENVALDWLERAWRTRQVHLPYAAVEYRLRELRDHPRFRSILTQAGLSRVVLNPPTLQSLIRKTGA